MVFSFRLLFALSFDKIRSKFWVVVDFITNLIQVERNLYVFSALLIGLSLGIYGIRYYNIRSSKNQTALFYIFRHLVKFFSVIDSSISKIHLISDFALFSFTSSLAYLLRTISKSVDYGEGGTFIVLSQLFHIPDILKSKMCKIYSFPFYALTKTI